MDKFCKLCQQTKPIEEFHSYTRKADNKILYKCYCRECYNEQQRKDYYKKKVRNYPSKIKKDISFVYILYNAYDEVIYVGKTSCIENRIKNHISRSKFKDEVKYIKFCICNSQAHSSIREIYYINLYKPVYNTVSKYDDEDILDITLPDKIFYRITEKNFKNLNTLVSKYTEMHYKEEFKDENIAKAKAQRNLKGKPVFKLDPKTLEILDYYPTCQKAEFANNIFVSGVSKACKNKGKAGGFRWCYVNDSEIFSVK